MTNALDWLPTLREAGSVLDPTGPGRHAPIDPADIAEVAALALAEDGHQGKGYALTGDETFTVAEQVRILSAAVGRDIEVREALTPDEAVRFRFPAGAPKALADAITEGLALMRADTIGFRTDTVERLLGRRPRTFADWCARNAKTFRRPAPPEALSAGRRSPHLSGRFPPFARLVQKEAGSAAARRSSENGHQFTSRRACACSSHRPRSDRASCVAGYCARRLEVSPSCAESQPSDHDPRRRQLRCCTSLLTDCGASGDKSRSPLPLPAAGPTRASVGRAAPSANDTSRPCAVPARTISDGPPHTQ